MIPRGTDPGVAEWPAVSENIISPMKREEAKPGFAIATLAVVLLGSGLAMTLGSIAARREAAVESGRQAAGVPPLRGAGTGGAIAARNDDGDRTEFDDDALFQDEEGDAAELVSFEIAREDAAPASAGGAAAAAVVAADARAIASVRDAAAAAAERIELAAAAAPATAPLGGARGAHPRAEWAAEEPPSSIGGRVLDPAGRPIPDAIVRLTVGPRTYAEARAGPDGRYVLENVKSGRYTLHARAHGFIDASLPGHLDVGKRERRDGVDLELEPGGAIEGRVIDARFEPVEGARVHLDRTTPFGPLFATTDVDGRFHFAGAAPGRNMLHVSDARYLPVPPRPVDVPRGEDGAPGEVGGVQVVLLGGAEIAGLLLGPEGKPADGHVDVFDERSRRVRGGPAPGGAFEFTGLEAGRYQIAAATVGRSHVAREMVDLRATDAVVRYIYLAPAGRIAGYVIDAQGFPVGRAQVLAAAERLPLARGAATGADGTFEISGLEDGGYKLTVVPPERYAAPEPARVVVSGGAGPTDIVLEVRLGAALRATIVAADGAPAAGAAVRVYDLRGNAVASGEADPAGNVRIARLPPGTVDVFACWNGELARLGTRVAPGEDHRMSIVLAPAARIRGRLSLADGRPVEGARIDATSTPDGVVRRSARAGADGSFEIGALYRGRYVLRAFRDGALVGLTELEVPESAAIDGVMMFAR